MDLNIIVLSGRITTEPEFRTFPSGACLARYLVTVRSTEPRRRVDVGPVSLWDPPDDLLALREVPAENPQQAEGPRDAGKAAVLSQGNRPGHSPEAFGIREQMIEEQFVDTLSSDFFEVFLPSVDDQISRWNRGEAVRRTCPAEQAGEQGFLEIG